MNRTVGAACLISLAIGLVFLFVRGPHPWGWNGFDHYHELALDIAAGRPFSTLDRPWGYAYFLAAFYRLFGDRPWIPLLVQVVLNATTPLLLFVAARQWTDRATASLAALLVGVFSFNTVYASTQSSDAVCTVLFLTAIVAFMAAAQSDRRSWFAVTGLLTGVASQFRPNLILIPALLAAYAVWQRPVRRYVVHATVLLACAGAVLMPWVIRNYRLTKTLLPTSVHGGAQLWYGTLQVGPYLNSRGYNPRSVFEAPAFEYTSLDAVPIVVRGGVSTCALAERHGRISLIYWTDTDATRHRLAPVLLADNGAFTFEIPPPNRDAVYYYYFDVTLPSSARTTSVTTPALGDSAPFVYFVSQNHLEDLDRHGDLLDIFDVIRLARHEAWSEPLPFQSELSRAGITDVPGAVGTLLAAVSDDDDATAIRVEHDDGAVRIFIGAGSSVAIPHAWSGRITDVAFTGSHADVLMRAHTSLAGLGRPRPPVSKADAQCALVGEIAINDVFYREQPEAMRRYSALAIDNIRREPQAFLMATLYRVYRVFVVVGTKDVWTAQQFRGSRLVYAAASAASFAFLAAFVAGVIIAWRRNEAMGLPLLLILYVPATIAPLLTNMRYSVTVQPLMFVFVALTLRAITGRPAREA
jgi:Dolichyl-phosphate-mannose-protein mannosyltransferase